jgi:hypothetical protein
MNGPSPAFKQLPDPGQRTQPVSKMKPEKYRWQDEQVGDISGPPGKAGRKNQGQQKIYQQSAC